MSSKMQLLVVRFQENTFQQLIKVSKSNYKMV